MREIKFRFWYSSESRMIYDSSEIENIEPTGINEAIKQLQGCDNFEIMQYTGLKDTHEKEIYEGDILKDKYSNLGEVGWHDSLGAWFWDGGFEWGMIEGDVEIIGNIYENPNLLEE